jgi:large subunit ribosomal protein L7/L12
VVLVVLAVWARPSVPAAPLGSVPRPQPQPAPVRGLTQDELAAVRALLADGQKIQAIKLVREITDLGLKEAKDYVEAL